MKIVIDRFEGDFAVAELPDGRFCNIPRCIIPEGASEGCIIDITINKADTETRAGHIRRRLDNLFGR